MTSDRQHPKTATLAGDLPPWRLLGRAHVMAFYTDPVYLSACEQQADLRKEALGVAGSRDRGALWWKKRTHYVGDTDKGSVDYQVQQWRKKNPRVNIKRVDEPGGASRGRDWHYAEMTVKRAAFWAGAHSALEKIAYGANNSVSATTDRDGPQTAGELGVEQGASGLGSRGNFSLASGAGRATTRGPGNQGSRGVPEWLRLLKHLHSPGTWSAGDKTGVKPGDKEMHVPYLQPDGVRS